MGKLLIEKKGHMPKALLLVGLVALALCVWYYAEGMYEHRYGDTEFQDLVKIAGPILLFMSGVLCTAKCYHHSKTYIRVYDDHIEGMGITKGAMAPHSFHFAKHMNYTVHVSNADLRVNCGSESYSIGLTNADAQAVYRCVYSGETAQPRPQPRPQAQPGPQAQPKTQTQPKPQAQPKPQPKPEAPAQKVIAVCPHCSAQCRVPAGKGLIRITCPNPGCGIPFTFES